MVSPLDFGSQLSGFLSRWRWYSAFDHHPSSQYDLNNVERDVKQQIIISATTSTYMKKQPAFTITNQVCLSVCLLKTEKQQLIFLLK